MEKGQKYKWKKYKEWLTWFLLILILFLYAFFQSQK